jgi:hypothetical protein
MDHLREKAREKKWEEIAFHDAIGVLTCQLQSREEGMGRELKVQ